MSAPTSISASTLLYRIGRPDSPVLIDLRTPEDFALWPVLVPGAIRHTHRDMTGLAAKVGDRPCVTICAQGRKLSQGAAAWLAVSSADARYLQGGQEAWRALGGPSVMAEAVPGLGADGTLWVTGENATPRRIGSCWLIRRWIDAEARVLFVSEGEALAVADRFDAIPFALPGAMEDPHALGAAVGLTHPLAARMFDALNDAALAPGIETLCAGLDAQHERAAERLEPGLSLCDALFAHLRGSGSDRAAVPA